MHNATVTIHSPRGEHRTFRITRRPDNSRWAPGQQVVALLTGQENETDYESFGFVRDDNSVRVFSKLRSQPGQAHNQWEIFADMIAHPAHYEARGYTYLEARRCSVCNRLLTTPESIAAGVGPSCSGRA